MTGVCLPAGAKSAQRLERAVEQTGLNYVDKDGVTGPRPFMAEIRSTTLVLTRCLASIQIQPTK
jgi:hypothetical protein